MLNAKIKWDDSTLKRQVAEGEIKGLYRAGAYLRKTARNSLHKSKKKTSAPGRAPIYHIKAFKNSIFFAVHKSDFTVYVGPTKLYDKVTNASGQPIPSILEFGGLSGKRKAPFWVFKERPKGITSTSSLARYFMKKKNAPLAIDNRKSMVRSVLLFYNFKEESMHFAQHYSAIKKKKVWLGYVPIRNFNQAKQAARTTYEYFGYPYQDSKKIKPRPFMGPALKNSGDFISKVLGNSI